MKCVKLCSVAILTMLISFESYPQGVLIVHGEENFHENIRIVDKFYKEKNCYINIDIEIPQIEGISNKDKESEINSSIISWTEDWIKEAKGVAKEFFEDGVPPLNPYELYARYKITNLERIISFYIDYYQFTGGAHGATIRKAHSVDINSGEKLTLKDLFEEGFDYKKIINDEITKQIEKEPEKYFIGKDGFKGIDENTEFYINNGDLVIYYQQYEIAPYVFGIPEFNISKTIFNNS